MSKKISIRLNSNKKKGKISITSKNGKKSKFKYVISANSITSAELSKSLSIVEIMRRKFDE